MKHISKLMEDLASVSSDFAGSTFAFALAVLLVVVWAATGPMFHYSDLWQLTINTGTSVITFLMVFLIQRAQNKDILSIQAKLNELISAEERASNKLINIEAASEEELHELHAAYEKIRDAENDRTG